MLGPCEGNGELQVREIALWAFFHFPYGEIILLETVWKLHRKTLLPVLR